MLLTMWPLIIAVLGYFASPVSPQKCVLGPIRKDPAFLNPGLYSMETSSSNRCRDQCWTQFRSWTAVITRFNLCLCGGGLMVANYTIANGCNSCDTDPCVDKNTVVNANSTANMYVTKGEVSDVNSTVPSMPTSFSFMNPSITWRYLNLDYISVKTIVNAYVDADKKTVSSVAANGQNATFDLPTLTPGYHSMTKTILDGGDVTYTAHDITFVGLVTNSIGFIAPTSVFIMDSFSVVVRVGELMQSNITITSCSSSNASLHALDTKSYTVGVLSTNGNVTSLLANYVYLMPFYTITEEVTLEQVRVNALNSSSVMIQIYRPQCANGTKYCYSLNTCLSSGLACPQAGVPKVNCSGSLIYKLSARACYDNSTQTVQKSPGQGQLFTSYFLFFDTVLTVNRGGYLTANNATSSTLRITLLPGDVPALMTTSTNVLSYKSLSTVSYFFPITNFNVSARANGYVVGAGNPLVRFNSAALSTNNTQSIPLVEMTLTKPAYILQNLTMNETSCSDSTTFHGIVNCSVNAQVANSYNSATASAVIGVFSPITFLNMTGPAIAPSFQSVQFSAVSTGTLPNFEFRVNDSASPGPWNVQGSDNFTEIPFSHFFIAPGVYSVSVNASNPRSSSQYSRVINVINPVADLSLWPVEIPGVSFGKPSQFIVTLSQATAATVTIDYGDGTSETVQVDDAGASASTNVDDYFVAIPSAVYQCDPFSWTNIDTARNCLRWCLNNFRCYLVTYDSITLACSYYSNCGFNASMVQRPYGSPKTLYILKRDICSTDPTVPVGRPFTWNATSGSNSSVDLSINGPGWVSASPTNQSLQINFAAPTQIFFFELSYSSAYSSEVKNYTVLTSNDAKTWAPISIWASGSSNSVSGVTARFMQLRTIGTGGTQPAGARVSMINCGLQTIKLSFSHNYTNGGLYNIVVNASNALNSMVAQTTQQVDRSVSNLNFIANLTGAVQVNSNVNFTLSGLWGDPIRITITRNDSITLLNTVEKTLFVSNTSNATFQSSFDYSFQFEKPGFYVVTATVTGSLNTDSAVSNLIVVDYPIPPIAIVGPAMGTYIPGILTNLSSLLVCVTNGSSYPTMATAYINYGSNATTPTVSSQFSCSSALNTSYSCPSGYSACALALGNSYNAPGIKTIQITVSSVINSVNASFDYIVWETVRSPLVKLKILPPLPEGVSVFNACLPAYSTVEFSASLASGSATPVNFTWNFGDGSALVTTSNPKVNYTYTNGSRGAVTLRVTNPVSSANTSVVQNMQGISLTSVCVMVPLSSSAISFSNDGPAEMNSTINFTFSVTGFPVAFSCYLLDFADPLSPNKSFAMWGNLSECASLPQFSPFIALSKTYSYTEQMIYARLPLEFSHPYYRIARSTATLNAGNRVSFVSLTSPVVIVKLSCSLPRVSIQTSLRCTPSVNCDSTYGRQVLRFWRSTSVSFSSNVTIKCAATNAAFFNWTIASCFDSNCVNSTMLTNNDFSEYIRRYNATPSLTGFYLRTASILPRALAYGLYQVCLNVSMLDQDGVWTQDCGFFSILPTSTVTSCINNFSPVITGRYLDNTFKLDGSCSTDPDVWPDQDQGLEFEWSCYRSCESTPTYKDNNGRFNEWDSSNNYSTNCSDTLANSQKVSNKGCFAAFEVHRAGLITPRNLSDWQLTDPKINPLYNDETNNAEYVNEKPKVFLWYMPTNSSIVLNTGTMFYKIQHIFLLTVRKKSAPNRWSQSSAMVSFTDVLPPQCSVVCVSNCYAAVQSFPNDPSIAIDPASALKLTGVINNFSPLIAYTFSWTVIYMQNIISLVDFSKILASPASYSSGYNFAAHSSTLNNKIGLSLDKQFPIINSTNWGKNVMFVLSITGQNVTGVTYILAQINSPPLTESCVVSTSPTSGRALSTQFQLACSCDLPTTKTYTYSLGFAVGVVNSFNNYQAMLGSSSACIWLVTGSSLCSFTDGVVLPAGDANRNNTVTVCVAVSDVVGSTNYTFIPSPVVKEDEKSAAIAMATLSNSNNLNEIMRRNPSTCMALVMAASTFISSDNTTSNSTATTPLSAAQLKNFTENVISAISTVNFESGGLQSVTQASQVLTRFTADPTAVGSSTVLLAADALSNMASSVSSASLTTSTSYNQLMSSASSVFTATSQVAAATQTSIKSNTNDSTSTAESSSKSSTSDEIGTSQKKDTYATLQRTLNTLADAVINVKVVDEGATQLTSSSLTLTVQTKSSALFGDTVVKPAGVESCTSFEFGSSEGVLAKSLNDTPQSVSFQHTSSQSTMFTWQPLASSINSETSMSLYQSSGNKTVIDVTSTPDKGRFVIWIDTGLTPKSVSSAYRGNKTLPFTRSTTQKMIAHSVTVKPHSALFVSVRQYIKQAVSSTVSNSTNSSDGFDAKTNTSSNQNDLLTINGTYNGTNIRFLVYVTNNPRGPTDTEYQLSCTLPITDVSELFCGRDTDWNKQASSAADQVSTRLNSTTENWWKNITDESTLNGDRCYRYPNKARDPYTCMFPENLLNVTTDKVFYVGIRAIISNDSIKVGDYSSNTTTPNTKATAAPTVPLKHNYVSVNYIFFAYPSACYFFNTTTDSFDTSGCTVGSCSSLYATQCICSHLTSFANVFSLPSIKFDVTSVNLNALNDSPGVTLFLVVIVCIYCIVWIWARRKDLDDRQTVGIVPLPSNSDKDYFAYEITVWTGHMSGSGTTARVSCVLAGDEAETRPRYLYNVKCNAFSRGSQRSMLLTTPVWLGELSHIRIWHDNTGDDPSWYFSRMLIRDVKTNCKYYFLVNSWLAVDRGSGVIEKLVPIAGKQELRGFEHVFWTRSTKQMLDGHMWLSVVTRPVRSRFTRVQRLTCCLMMCCLSILFNLLGFIVKNSNTTADSSSSSADGVLFSIGSTKITVWTMTIACISALVTVPVNIIVLLLFKERSVKLKKSCLEHEELYSKYKDDKNLTSKGKASPGTSGMATVKYNKNNADDEDTKSCCESALDALSHCLGSVLRAIFPLPWFTHIIAYVIVLVVVGVCWFCVLVLAYSNLSGTQMDSWLQAIALSLVVDIVIIQPLQIVAIVTLFAFILREPVNDEENLADEVTLMIIEKDADGEAANDNLALSMQPSRTLDPPDRVIVEGLRKKVLDENKTERALLSIVGFALLIGLLFAAIYANVPTSAYGQTRKIRISTLPTTRILDIKNAYEYVFSQWLPFLHFESSNAFIRSHNLNSDESGPHDSTNFAADGAFYVLAARMRQVRFAPNSKCDVPDMLKSVISFCAGALGDSMTDSDDYEPSWVPIASNGSDSNISNISYIQRAFRFRAENSLLASTMSLVGAYPTSSGYVVDVKGNLSQSLKVLQDVMQSKWMDNRTRIVLFEFLLYNIQTRLFTASSSYLEFFNGVRYHSIVQTLYLDWFASASGGLAWLLQLIAAAAIVIYNAVVIYNACKAKGKDLLSGWYLLDWAIAIISAVAVGVTIGFYISSQSLLTSIKNSKQVFVQLEFTACLLASSYALLGLLIFLLTVRLLKLLMLSARFALIGKTIEAFLKVALNFLMQVLALIMTFAFALFLVCTSVDYDFSTLVRALVTVCSILTGKSNQAGVFIGVMPVLAELLFIAYVFVMVMVFMRVTICLLRTSWHSNKKNSSAITKTNDILSYVASKAREVWCWALPEGTEQGDGFEYIYGETQYEQALMQFKDRAEDMLQQFHGVVQQERLLKVQVDQEKKKKQLTIVS